MADITSVRARGIEAAMRPQRDVHQAHERRHLNQGADHAGQRLLGGDAEHANRHSDGKLEVIACRRERQRRRLRVRQAQYVAEHEGSRPT
jgi:hypothetical protein